MHCPEASVICRPNAIPIKMANLVTELPGFEVFPELRILITLDYLSGLLFELWRIKVWDRV